MKQDKIIIEMDDRESECQLMADVGSLNIVFDRKRLKVGDFIYGDLIMERKTVDDFCSSILDGRLKRQAENMKATGKMSYIFIIGDFKKRDVGIHDNCIKGKIISLLIKYDIKLVYCEDEMEFLWMMDNLCRKYKELYSKELKGGVINGK